MDGPAAGFSATAEALYDDAPCGMLVTTTAGLILQANRTFCTWLGRGREDLVEQVHLQDLMTMGARIFHHTHWSPLMQIQGSVSEVKLELQHQDGRKLPMVLNAKVRTYGALHVHEVALFIAEDRHKYEQELMRARRTAEALLEQEQVAQRAVAAAQAERDRLKALAEDRALFAEQMVAIVSHDLRNPLSVVQMSAHILAASELGPQQKLALDRLKRATSRAIRLIADLLDFSRGRLGSGLKVALVPVDLHAVTEDAIQDLLISAAGRQIVHERIGDGGCLGNVDRLIQLIGNLVSNAVTYGSADQPVKVTSGTDAQASWVSVHNHGPAISPAFLPHLFDPMTRGTVANGSETSVGLGLFIVKQIVDAHGGTVRVDSAADTGTTFTAVFPRQPAQAQEAAPTLPLSAAELGECARLEAVARLALSTLREPAYDDITRLAADMCDAPIALINVVEADHQWSKSRVGLELAALPKAHSFCAVAIETPMEIFVVEDASKDPRFAMNPLVSGEAGVRFYAGAPLVTGTGRAIGTICVFDRKPRQLDGRQHDLLRFLAEQVVARFEEQVPIPFDGQG